MGREPTMNPDSSAPDVLLAGCGDLNTQVGLRLSAQGLSVLGIRRRPERRRLPFQVIQRDLTESAGKALPAAESVVVALTADTTDAAGYERAYRETLRGLAAMLPEAPRRLVFVSSTSVLGEHGGKVVTEEIPPAAERQTAQVLNGRLRRCCWRPSRTPPSCSTGRSLSVQPASTAADAVDSSNGCCTAGQLTTGGSPTGSTAKTWSPSSRTSFRLSSLQHCFTLPTLSLRRWARCWHSWPIVWVSRLRKTAVTVPLLGKPSTLPACAACLARGTCDFPPSVRATTHCWPMSASR